MLFSNASVAGYINRTFEPAWVSLRPVPIVRVDFGNGKSVTRTLHGNIATSVCTAEGNILDILPGVYRRETYLSRLSQFAALHRWVRQEGEALDKRIKRYHRTQAQALANGKPPHVLSAVRDFSKVVRIEGPLKYVLTPPTQANRLLSRVRAAAEGQSAERQDAQQVASPRFDSQKNRTLWDALARDTRFNETARRRLIHERLSDVGAVAPGDITRWLYREVLHTDLDDPYLGLGELLFATYPFRDKDES